MSSRDWRRSLSLGRLLRDNASTDSASSIPPCASHNSTGLSRSPLKKVHLRKTRDTQFVFCCTVCLVAERIPAWQQGSRREVCRAISTQWHRSTSPRPSKHDEADADKKEKKHSDIQHMRARHSPSNLVPSSAFLRQERERSRYVRNVISEIYVG